MNNCEGIELRGSSENQISYSDISQNIGDGVLVQADINSNTIAEKNDITFNMIHDNSSSTSAGGLGGVDLGTGADSNVVAFNTIFENQENGIILLTGSRKNIIASNSVTGNSTRNGNGITVLKDSTGNYLLSNTAKRNGQRDADDGNRMNCTKNTWLNNDFGLTIPCVGSPTGR
jgi:hypothetical protein